MLVFDGAYLIPGLGDVRGNIEKEIWWGRFEHLVLRPMILSGASRDSGSDPTDMLRPGLLMGQITATKKYKEWSPTATDGSQFIAGILLYDQKVTYLGTDSDRYVPIVLMGNLKASCLLIPGEANYGISGHAYELLIRSQLSAGGRFVLDDIPQGSNYAAMHGTLSLTDDVTLTATANNWSYNNVGTAKAITITLPAPRVGFTLTVTQCAAFGITVTPAAANQFIYNGDASADTAFLSSIEIGSVLQFIGISATKWLVRRIPAVSVGTVAAAGDAVGNAAAIPALITTVTAADATKGVILPVVSPGTVVRVINTVAAVLNIYPPTGGQINAGGANVAYAAAASKIIDLIAITGTTFYAQAG